MINVILADHQPIFRTGTARILAVEEDIRIVGQSQSPALMLNAARMFRPHVVMLSSPFLEALPELSTLAREQRIALMMLAEKEDDATEYADLGFQGVIYRSAEPNAVVKAVRRLARGDSFIQPSYPARDEAHANFANDSPNTQLTGDELRIVQAVIQGFKNRQIALHLNLKEQAVKNALRAIFDKLGISDRLELALYVLAHNHLKKTIAQLPKIAQPGNLRKVTAPALKFAN
jgi:DNA-binding NarL/FixJ family response regulator